MPSSQPPAQQQTQPLLDILTNSLSFGAIHDWIAAESASGPVLPSLGALTGVAGSVVAAKAGLGRVLWIGRRCWPYPPSLDERVLERSVFIDPPTQDDRLWAIDQCLRSMAVSVIVADARGLTMANSRRLQLAAEAGGAMALLSRPARERGELSAATTRWLVSPGPPDPLDPIAPTWTFELLRRKGLRPISEGARVMTVRVEDATRLVCFDADAPGRPASATRPSHWSSRRSG